MKERIITDEQGTFSLTVDVVAYDEPRVAVFNTDQTGDSMHIDCATARRFARSLLEAADKAEKRNG